VSDNTRLDLIDASDMARFASVALDWPAGFSGKKTTLVVEKLTTAQMAEELSTISEEGITQMVERVT
jgi:uncharacterized protein YbjT (DUF2867 family)